MEIIDRIVDFTYCETCKHKDLADYKDPCNDCLDNPVNSGTDIPMYYEEDEKGKKEDE